MTFKAHYMTLFYLIRSYWLAFTAPIIRIVIQYVIYKDAQLILPLEAIVLMLAIVFSAFRWFYMNITVTRECVIISKGVFIKQITKIKTNDIFCIYTNQNVMQALLGCVSCKFLSLTNNNKKPEIFLKTNDAKEIYNIIYTDQNCATIDRQKNLSRFLFVPIAVIVVLIIYLIAKQNYVAICAIAIFDLFYGVACYCDYKYGQMFIGDRIYAKKIDILGLHSLHCSKNRLGVITIFQNPFDKRHKTCKIKLSEWGSTSCIKVKHLNFKDVKKHINAEFKINISE